MINTEIGPTSKWHFSMKTSLTVVLEVRMSCEDCAGVVKRALETMEGVESVDIDLQEQKVTIKGYVQPDAVLQIACKAGKKATFFQYDIFSPFK
ncbi:copper transport protein ATX1-like [Herrania umbratica]|uniref:Copper transport protein ATX1-like n=1 Tax=Herrania umbratica TaxID=108875 RepID=A0A6J1BA37_9ROSI|nr:copper transport protein ATX1-like [Herrania umbratica]